MPSGRIPELERRRQALKLRQRGWTLEAIARKFGVTRQAVWSLLNTQPQRSRVRVLVCTGCGALIVSDGALRNDAPCALCLDCLETRPEVSFGRRLKALRLAAGLTRTELCRMALVPTGALRAYERDQRKPQASTVARLARKLGADLVPGMCLFSAERQRYNGAS
jgi:transcriptional regulator with XRE-family HTH domain